MYGTETIGDGPEIRQLAPATCPDGHPLRPGNVTIHHGCPHGDSVRMNGWLCWQDGQITWQDGTVQQWPVPMATRGR